MEIPQKRKAEPSNWWEEDLAGPSSKYWTTLEHKGVTFPPPYQPHRVPVLYKNEPVVLPPQEEEVATWWASVVDTEWETKEIFRKNFEKNFLDLLGKNHTIKDLDNCDFSQIKAHLETQREARKNRPQEEKKAERELKQKNDEEMGYAIVDGVREKVSNLMVEPPGLFRGRGQHPKAGYLKTRLKSEDITINIGKDNVVPKCSIPGHAWKNVVHNDMVTWLAYYKDPELSFSNVKYVYLAASSKFKGLSDKLKYEKSRKLKSYIDGIRTDYLNKIKSESKIEKELGTALYLIDKLALRVGNEKSEEEADTVGCCSLRVEHISFGSNNQVTLDFLGKDSMRYYNTVEVDPEVYENLQLFVEGKNSSEDLFESINTSSLNDYLKSFMEGLSAKVFRTYNASFTLEQQLQKYNFEDKTVEEKIQNYTDANREVAILCNHQKSTPKNFEVQIEKMQDKLKSKLEYLNFLEKHLLHLQEKGEKVDPPEGQKPPASQEAARRAITRTQTTVKNMEIKLKMKDENKTVALGTSKINYMDPRITVAWCKRNEVPIEKVFPKTLRAKFIWAMYAEPEWSF